jgi:hypothetical protein
MSTVLADLKEKAAQLPEPERAELVLSMIESLDGPADEVFTRLRRRLGLLAPAKIAC